MPAFDFSNLFESDSRTGIVYKNGFKIVTGDGFKKVCTERFKYKRRFFVDEVVKLCSNPLGLDYIYGVGGIRGVGKTIGLFHAIDELNEYDNTAYIELLEQKSIYDVMSILSEYKDLKYFFIDEVTFINDFINKGNYLSSFFNEDNKVCFISGTDSYALIESKLKALFHRIYLIKVSYISYLEHNMLTGISVDNYIKYGGMLDERVLHDTNSEELLSEIVISNIVNTITRNIDYFLDSGEFDPQTLDLPTSELSKYIKSIIFYICYCIIFKTNKNTRLNFLNKYTDKKYISEFSQFLELLGLDLPVEFYRIDLGTIAKALKKMELIVEVSNYADSKDRQFYISNSAISYVLFRDFVSVSNLPLNIDGSSKYKFDEHIKGRAFESMFMNEIYHMYNNVYFYVDSNIELDAILCNDEDTEVIAIEIKSRNTESNCIDKTTAIRSYNNHNLKRKIICTRVNFGYEFKDLGDKTTIVPFSYVIEYLNSFKIE